jgi:beta-lactamase regulating signal transducer with metallopeptidase domain
VIDSLIDSSLSGLGSLASVCWIVAWQSTLWLTIGLVAGGIWRRRAGRAHSLLLLATFAAIVTPALTLFVSRMQWGGLPGRAGVQQAVVGNESDTVVDARSVTVQTARATDRVDTEFDGSAEMRQVRSSGGGQRNPEPRSIRHDRPASASSSTPAVAEWRTSIIRGVQLTVAVWLATSILLATRLIGSLAAAARMVRQSKSHTDYQLLIALREAANALGVGSSPRLQVSTAVRSPMIWCWGMSPAVLLPESDVGQPKILWRSIFCHELAHLVRHDHWSALWAELVVVLVPWQPLAWRARRRLAFLREQACDDWVLFSSSVAATDYAESLLQLVAQGSPVHALAAVSSNESLKRRLEHVLGGLRVAPRVGLRWIIVTGLLALCAIAGIGFAQQGKPLQTAIHESANAPQPDDPAKPRPRSAVDGATKEVTRDEGGMTICRGTVLRPDGKPAAGVKVLALRRVWSPRFKHLPIATTMTAPDGSFEIRVPKLPYDGRGTTFAMIAAVAEGFGTQCVYLRGAPPKPLVLKLLPQFPIHGRVIDVAGKPVAGVRVQLREAQMPSIGENLDAWFTAAKMDLASAYQNLRPWLPGYDEENQPPIRADRDGRFTLLGIGPERLVTLELSGDGIASAEIGVVTRAMVPFSRARVPSPLQVFGSDFTYQAQPTRPVVGTVRDAVTGQPLRGVGVELQERNFVRTETDAEGKFRLVGMPTTPVLADTKQNHISFEPTLDQPYFAMLQVEIPQTNETELEPVTLEIKLRRGLWITGRVTDKVTGKPVEAHVEYLPCATNPSVSKAEYRKMALSNSGERYQTKPDGTYRALGLPGRGILAARGWPFVYRKGVGASAIPGIAKNGNLPTLNSGNINYYDSLKEVDPPVGTQSITCDLALDPSGSVRLTLVDAAGKPVENFMYLCSSPFHSGGRPKSTFEVGAISPKESRTYLIWQAKQKLAKLFTLDYGEKAPSALTITLVPSATIKGRIVDVAGRPVKNMLVVPSAMRNGKMLMSLNTLLTATTDEDGRFACPNLGVGSDGYRIDATSPEEEEATIAEKVQIAAGNTIDLGVVTFRRKR